MFKVTPIIQPGIDLGQFKACLDADSVNSVDGQLRGPVDKFVYLADYLLTVGSGEKFLFYGFYFELPVPVMCDMTSFQFMNAFRMTTYDEGLMAKGIIVGPLDLWKLFIEYGLRPESSKILQQACDVMLKTLPIKVTAIKRA